eukprot:CAMPEP_0184490578 /NCGR_PEP_ID=MMETSP0113_2-20130426/18239_1 /TAXON_ID=91329 /ORGANISM="Norrisiella sphaerica, Strain BC52" /LENGTH=403 /DNA_ID=CAMNT_0026874523 /DNA_START=189 /DNA_END=1400 /DNA_ORIENTATION=+
MKSIPEMATFSASEDISGHSASSNDTQSQECLSRQEISDLSPGKCGISRLAPDETTLKDSPSPSTNVRVNVQAKAVDGKTAGFDSSEDGSKGRRRAESTKKRKISKENRAQEKRRKLESSLNSRKKMMQNPLSPCVTPRRKDSSDLLGFVSLSLAPPRDISKEWEIFKAEIITPPWKQKMIHEERDDESSSEEDTSDEKYFAWHKRSYERDCQRVQKVLEMQAKSNSSLKKSLSNTKKKGPAETSTTQTFGNVEPLVFNYPTGTQVWVKPADLIRLKSNNDDSKFSVAATPQPKKVIPKQKEERKPVPQQGLKCKGNRRKKRKSIRKELRKIEEDDDDRKLAVMRVKYLKLRARLEKLKGTVPDREEGSTKPSWMAEKLVGENGRESNVIRLRLKRVASECAA